MTSPWQKQQARLKNARRATAALTICTDPDTLAEVDRRVHSLRDARAKAAVRMAGAAPEGTTEQELAKAVEFDDVVVAAHTALAAAERARDEAMVEFFFRALPSHEYEALVAEHPPTDDERKQGRRWHLPTFGPVIVSACHVVRDGGTEHPGMTVDDARDLFRDWSAGDRDTLVATAIAVNETSRLDYVSLGKG